MTVNKKIVPTAVTADTVNVTNQCNQTKDSYKNSLPQDNENDNQCYLLQCIPFGRANAISAKKLAERAGYKDVRALMIAIHSLRTEGEIILSATESPSGYYQSEDIGDIRAFVKNMDNRIVNTELAVAGAKKYLEEIG